MLENIELRSFCVSANTESDNEEYHEITFQSHQDDFTTTRKASKHKEYDFFTDLDVEPVQKPGQRRKKSHVKRRETTTNLMDIVNSELASVSSPVTENTVVTLVDERQKEQSSFLLTLPSITSMFRKSHRMRADYENGTWRQLKTVNLSPIFPRILENALPTDYAIPVQYVYPLSFEELTVNKYTEETEGNDKFLDITIKNIYFLHHHYFSLENLLCRKLIDTYKTYQICKNNLKDLSRDIKVTRETRNNIKEELSKISPDKKDELKFDKTVRKYTGNLLRLKKQYIELIKKQKELIHKIISLWADVEMVREKSGKTETPYIIEVINVDSNENQFEEEWCEVYNVELNDLLDKIEYDYVSRYLEYKDLKQEQNLNKAEKKKLSKPKLQVDVEELKEQVEKIVGKILTRDKMDLILNKDENLALLFDKKGEKNLLNYHFDIYVDTVFVCTSETYKCEKDSLFEINLTESFSIQILPKNKFIYIALIENNEKVSMINVDISKINRSDIDANFVTYSFVYNNKIVPPTHSYVGSGYNIKDIAKENKVRLKSSNIFAGNLETNCKVSVEARWNKKLSKHDIENVRESMDTGRKIARLMHGLDKPSIDSLTDLMEKIYGKNVSKDSKLTQTIQDLCKCKLKPDLEFPINENNPEFVRFKLLHLRNIGGFSNVQNKMVPIHVSQLSTEHLSCLQRINEKYIDIEYINDKYAEMDPIELQRFIGCKYVQKLNQNMLKNLHDHLMKRTHKDVVRDYRNLSLRSLFSRPTNLIDLASVPKSTKQQYLNDSISKEQEIRVTVIRAYNLMDRSSTILTEDNDEDNSTIAGFKVRPLRPYIRLSYHGISAQTATAIGCHPTWNQTVKIKTKLHPISSLHINLFDEYKTNVNDGDSDDETSHGKSMHYRCYSRWLGTLQVPLHTVLTSGTLRGAFKLATPPFLFGYEVPQNKDATRTLIPEVTRLLRKDTSFVILQITTSLSHLGGLHAYNQPIPTSVDDDDLIKHLNNAVTSYSNDFLARHITLTFIDSSGRNKCVTQFLQPLPPPNYDYFPKNPKSRGESALSKSSGVSKSSSSKSSGGRKKDVVTERGNLSPRERESIYSGFEGNWKGESQFTKMMNACLRYVSLIPTYEVTESHVVTLMGLELLKVLYGSPLDHTILLAGYFLHLGVKCWVVMGAGLPRGSSGFVLTKYDLTSRRDVLVNDHLLKSKGLLNKGDGYLWYVYDATTGERFELRDVSCPLKTVDYIFDEDNIWLNMQSSQDCENVSFDLSRSSYWMPVFDKNMFVMRQSLVTDSSLYSAPPDITALRETLESKIKTKVQKWRTHFKTVWNRYGSSLLRECLHHWEYWTFNQSEPKPGANQRLKQLMITYKAIV
ncbi:unnamed protein product [Chilo suppressalis]|uniref:C2 domain-containing protein n=1 Tax=Chilo suppressalis TaxID=168631 RepID=A0ABN8B0R6_CHISP|nr:unnamed protein product [Chilo suppressalis]